MMEKKWIISQLGRDVEKEHQGGSSVSATGVTA